MATVSVDRVGLISAASGRTEGQVDLSTDPAWARMLRWQKSLVDTTGTKARPLQAGSATVLVLERSRPELAMNLDGGRVASSRPSTQSTAALRPPG
jgi:hypothetical protein